MLTRNPNQFTVRLVQRSHGRNEHARLVFYLRLGPGNRGENFHATSIPYLPAMRESRSVSRSPECQIESCSGTPTSTKNQSPQSKRPIKRSTVLEAPRQHAIGCGAYRNTTPGTNRRWHKRRRKPTESQLLSLPKTSLPP